MNFSPETAAGAITIVGITMLGLKKLGWLTLGKNNCQKNSNGECPDPDCQTIVTQTSSDVKTLGESQKKISTAIFGPDGTGGMVKTLHGVEFCVRSLAKDRGIELD